VGTDGVDEIFAFFWLLVNLGWWDDLGFPIFLLFPGGMLFRM